MALHFAFMTSRTADDAAVYREISRALQFRCFALMHKAEKLIEKVFFSGGEVGSVRELRGCRSRRRAAA